MTVEQQTGTVTRTAQHVEMTDGTLIGVTLYRPDTAAPVPLVLRATRYWRLPSAHEPRLWTDNTVALALVDVRGTGASTGTWRAGWQVQEVDDLVEVLDKLTSQAWSDGTAAIYGGSYDANLAILLAARCHPALRAVVALYPDWDPYEHLTHPGGVRLEGFLNDWGAFTRALDTGDLDVAADALGVEAKTMLTELAVPGADLTAAFAGHADNDDVRVVTRNIRGAHDITGVSPRQVIDGLRASQAALWIEGSWYDAGTAAGALEAFEVLPQSRVTICSGSHGGTTRSDPFTGLVEPADFAAKLDAIATFVTAATKGCEVPGLGTLTLDIPGLGTRAFTQSPRVVPRQWTAYGSRLQPGPDGTVSLWYDVDPTATSGGERWASQLDGRPIPLSDRSTTDATLPCWTSEPLSVPLALFGAPHLSVDLVSSSDEGALHATLSVVSPTGESRELTQGHLRLAQGNAVALPLLPVAVAIPVGHALRLTIAGADAGVFEQVPAEPNGTRWHIKAVTLTLPEAPDLVA